ncbi:hypothetical protein KTO58_01220 [Chitinophaga pendula]|uniref:hypothetical protein n=1 Tax=Chitinophaga TaxID=79328 RepID=UPI000BB08F3E|nr:MULTISPECIES: hypothetical protein [Chitinophaga]ASZ14517.1 hypothetical protein CK934_28000 [Chitinophaga sp. MD30]UCJ07826.1 hypothetical protein KTO58_01220 [Chitinophaga pendula]
MASESKLQRQLLESGFLDDIGQARGGDKLKFTSVEQVFIKHMGQLLKRLQERVNAPQCADKEITASGGLSASMRFEYTFLGVLYRAQFYMASYADYQDKGVRGLGSNNQNTTSPYSFRFKNASRNHVDAIEGWLKEKNNLTDRRAPKGLLTAGKKNHINDAIQTNRSIAYAIAVAGKSKGLKAQNFKQGAIDDVMPGLMKELAQAMARDIKISIDTSVLQ